VAAAQNIMEEADAPHSPIFDLQLHSGDSPARLRPTPGTAVDVSTVLPPAFPFPKRSSRSLPDCFGSRELRSASDRHCLRASKSLRTSGLEPLAEHAADEAKPQRWGETQPVRIVGFHSLTPSPDEARDDAPARGIDWACGRSPVQNASPPYAGRSVASPPPTIAQPNLASPAQKMLVSRAGRKPYDSVLLSERHFATAARSAW